MFLTITLVGRFPDSGLTSNFCRNPYQEAADPSPALVQSPWGYCHWVLLGEWWKDYHTSTLKNWNKLKIELLKSWRIGSWNVKVRFSTCVLIRNIRNSNYIVQLFRFRVYHFSTHLIQLSNYSCAPLSIIFASKSKYVSKLKMKNVQCLKTKVKIEGLNKLKHWGIYYRLTKRNVNIEESENGNENDFQHEQTKYSSSVWRRVTTLTFTTFLSLVGQQVEI